MCVTVVRLGLLVEPLAVRPSLVHELAFWLWWDTMLSLDWGGGVQGRDKLALPQLDVSGLVTSP